MNGIVKQIGMTRKQAKRLEMGIVYLCLLALALIFQPFSKTLFTIGAILIFVGGLAFNLVPVCVEGKTYGQVLRTAMIVVIVFIVVLLLSIGSAYLYGIYLTMQ